MRGLRIAGDEQVAMSPGHGCAVRGTAQLLIPHLHILTTRKMRQFSNF